MQVVASSPNPAGHVVIVRVPGECRLTARFFDEPEERDLTSWSADLIVIGLAVRHERAIGVSAEPTDPDDKVDVGEVRFDGDLDGASFVYLHQNSGTTVDFTAEEALTLAELGVSSQITAGVATEAADVPDDASGLAPWQEPGDNTPGSDGT